MDVRKFFKKESGQMSTESEKGETSSGKKLCRSRDAVEGFLLFFLSDHAEVLGLVTPLHEAGCVCSCDDRQSFSHCG
ncbi:hypothetical protein ILYODFUR_027459 [Ilyodon furcidens]|uniref:Uncharacterized protein n=1 Tax=Ilyodon furcidens TaxID=33524 RepID=A0ABV0SS84_9TELE